MKATLLVATTVLGLFGPRAGAITVDVNDGSSVRDAASTIAYGLMKYYTGNNTGDTPGNLPPPYYWWEAGAMFGTMIDYWYLTQDSSYVNETIQAMVHQAGTAGDFMPQNQTLTEGNDDQGFWAMAAMSAAENVFPNPPSDDPQWLAMAQAVFNEYASRWDLGNCDGGLRWQIFAWNKGYNYKNSIANGCFFNIAARLARYTGNTTYSDWATKIYDWETQTGLISNTYGIYDGASISSTNTCTPIDTTQWSYNAGVYMHGAAAMYNVTQNSTWKDRLDGIINATNIFLKNGIVYEQFCEPSKLCDVDQLSFKGYLIRWMAYTTKFAPYTYNTLMPIIKTAAAAAASICSGPASSTFKGIDGTACGFSWLTTYDGINGVGPQMDALSAVMYTLTPNVSAPVTANTGGTSQGNPSAGSSTSSNPTDPNMLSPPTTGGKVGAAFLTIIMLVSIIGGSAVLVV